MYIVVPQKQKERRRLERAKQNPVKNNEVVFTFVQHVFKVLFMCALMFYLFIFVLQEEVDEQQSKAEESKSVNDKSNSSASAKDTDSSDGSEDESSDEDGDTKNDSDDSEVPQRNLCVT